MSNPARLCLALAALCMAQCGSSGSGIESNLQCRCVRNTFISGFLDRTLPDGTECTNAAIGGCDCLASECVNYCAFDKCQPECETDDDCAAENEECNELLDADFGSLGFFCEFVPPCPEGSVGCPCGPAGACDPPSLSNAESVCNEDNICEINDLCAFGCRQGSVCCGGALCAGNCIGTPCC